MLFEQTLGSHDQALLAQATDGFLPDRIADIHAHVLYPQFYQSESLDAYAGREFRVREYSSEMAQFFNQRPLAPALFFGLPARGNDRPGLNNWLRTELENPGTKQTGKGLILAAPGDDRNQISGLLQSGFFAGIKPYHLYAAEGDTQQAKILEYAPEWMWELCHTHKAILMLHLVRDASASDQQNQETLRELCEQYPDCMVILAHVARAFNYRTAKGLKALADLPNVRVDTSVVTESEAIRTAIEILGVNRVLYGSDYPLSHLRGRCVATGSSFTWLYADASNREKMTLVGIESLLCLREAAEDLQLSPQEIERIFYHNAMGLLHAADDETSGDFSRGPARWKQAKTKISCGTGLRSKWAEVFDPRTWPSYFSRCEGCHIWDADGRKYTDFAAGAGAILLGFSDPDVNQAVQARVRAGSYCSLVSPDETKLAEVLLGLHPWARRLRYARGGGDGMGVAVRIARAATGKSGVAFCGYHGWQDWYLAANLAEDKALDGHLLPGLKPLGVPRELAGTAVPFRYNDKESFATAMDQLDGRLAAVVMEPMRTQLPKDGFLDHVSARCKKAGAVLVFDEVTSGWRFGFPGAAAALDIQPDLAVYAKATSNGFPFAAILGNETIMDAATESFISSSYWTDGVGPAAALAAVHKMQSTGSFDYIWNLGRFMLAGMREVAARHPSSQIKVWGMPSNPYMTFELGEDSVAAKTWLVRAMLAKGYLTTGAALFIMHSHTEEIVNRYLEAVDQCLDRLDKLVEGANLRTEVGASDAMGNFSRLT